MKLRFSSFNLLAITCSLLLSPFLQRTAIALENTDSSAEVQTAQASTTAQPTQLTSNRATQAEAYRLSQQGQQQLRTSQFQLALSSFQQALRLYQEAGAREAEAIMLNNIGMIYARIGDYSQALNYYWQALAIIRQVDNRAEEGNILNNVGQVYAYRGQYSQALEQFLQSLAIAREMDDRYSEGVTLSNIGMVYRNLGQYLQALEYSQQALAIVREVGDPYGEGTILGNLGVIQNYLGQYSQAVGYYQQALIISKEINDRDGEGITLSNMGVAYRNSRQYLQSLNYYQQALVIARDTGNRYAEGAALGNMGEAYTDLGQYSQAEENLQQALVVLRDINQRAGEGSIFMLIGKVHQRLGQYSQAMECYQQSLVIAREVNDRWGESTALSYLGSVQRASGQVEAATETLFDAVEALESLRSSSLADADKVSLLDTQLYTYNLLQQALLARNQPEVALEVSERGRAQAFAELLANRSSPQTISENVPTAPSIAHIQQIAREQNATLVEYSIAYAPVQVEGRESWQPSKLYVWVVKPTGEVAFRQADLTAGDASLHTLIVQGRQAIVPPNRRSDLSLPPQIGRQPEQTQERLQQLYQVLIEPIVDLLPTNPDDHVVFIPQGELFAVPFPALQDANGQYLIENHTILTAPSIQVLGMTQQLRRESAIEPSQILVVGNPTMPTLPTVPPQPPLPSLPGAEQEAIAIAQQFHTQPLLGAAATETAVVQRMQTARLIHLATHGLLEYGDPRASGVRDMPGAIALAPSAQDDGLLTASEISNLSLSADLVVLSACNTARGDITGDGVIGLSRALISAGVPSVIVSLWTVPDDSTEVLMSKFYQQLRQQPDKAQSLRQAMLQTMQEFPNPVDWAAFTLIGEAD